MLGFTGGGLLGECLAGCVVSWRVPGANRVHCLT